MLPTEQSCYCLVAQTKECTAGKKGGSNTIQIVTTAEFSLLQKITKTVRNSGMSILPKCLIEICV